MQSDAEAAFLTKLAGSVAHGCIVEIGSWRGGSAVALARGALSKHAHATEALVYCIEPHAPFTGVYGGKFSPADRSHFYKAMIQSGVSEHVALVAMPSLDAAKGWRLPIGLLFIDGDHSEQAVEADVAAWSQHVLPGGVIALDDAVDPAVGPKHVISRLLAGGKFRLFEAEGKIVALQKVAREMAQQNKNARAEAIEEISRRAGAAGYNEPWAVGRIAYASFVSTQHRYCYIETPKAACTSLKHLVCLIEGVSRDPARRPVFRESRQEMHIHERGSVPLPSILDVSAADRSAIFDGDEGWLLLAVSRNPYSRLVSVFESKVRMGEPGYGTLEQRYGDRGPFAHPQAAFSAFITEVAAEEQARTADAHLLPQSQLLLPRMITYRQVFEFEALDAALQVLGAHVGARGGPRLPPLPRFNASPRADWRRYYTAASAACVAEIYREDFELFGYDTQDWRPAGGQSEPWQEPVAERRWRGEVVARNRMLDTLYDIILKP